MSDKKYPGETVYTESGRRYDITPSASGGYTVSRPGWLGSIGVSHVDSIEEGEEVVEDDSDSEIESRRGTY
jgi:hypothetical protein